jgi:hypothetical protein
MGVSTLKRRAAALAALLILGGCGQGGQTGGGGASADKFAGLDGAILNWRKEIIATDALCKATAEDQKCQSFEVACKAERTVTPADQAKGVTAHVVVMMTWNGFDQKFKHPQSGTLAAEFTKAGAGWSRAPHGPVYMQTCADL